MPGVTTVDRNRLLKELLTRSIKETLEELPRTTEVFRAKEYDLNKVVTNELDFLLGAVFSQILYRYSIYCWNRRINPTSAEATAVNISLFAKASEYRDAIKKLAGL